MNNLEFANVLTEAVKEVIVADADTAMDNDLKEAIWEAIYEQLNKEIH